MVAQVVSVGRATATHVAAKLPAVSLVLRACFAGQEQDGAHLAARCGEGDVQRR